MIYHCTSLFTERYILTMKRFDCILQHDSMQCGAVCLSMICKHYGIPYPIEHISNICPATIKKNKFYIADPGKGLVKYSLKDFEKNWISTETQGVKKGIAMILEPEKEFDKYKSAIVAQNRTKQKSFGFLFNYIKQYGRYFTLILMGRNNMKNSAPIPAIRGD